MAGVWTQADVDSIKEALRQGVLSVSYAGPPARTVTYQSTSDLMELLAVMLADTDTSERKRYHVMAHRSGL